jgi:hypothetical protein
MKFQLLLEVPLLETGNMTTFGMTLARSPYDCTPSVGHTIRSGAHRDTDYIVQSVVHRFGGGTVVNAVSEAPITHEAAAQLELELEEIERAYNVNHF